LEKESKNSLNEWSNVINKSNKNQREKQKEIVKSLTSEMLICINARLTEFNEKALYYRLIECELTNKSCVCSILSDFHKCAIMNQNYENCPGYKSRVE
jgi:hypothetical protein